MNGFSYRFGLTGFRVVHGFLSVEDLAELEDGPNWCGEVVRGLCVFTWNFSVTNPTVHNRERQADKVKHAVPALVTRSLHSV